MYRRLLTFLYNISLYPNAWAWGGCLTILIPFFLFYFCLDFLLSFLETDGVWNTGLLIDFDNGVELETSHCISSARLSILSLSLRSVSISAIWTVCFNCLAIGHSTGGTHRSAAALQNSTELWLFGYTEVERHGLLRNSFLLCECVVATLVADQKNHS